jgi:hypothetical protein
MQRHFLVLYRVTGNGFSSLLATWQQTAFCVNFENAAFLAYARISGKTVLRGIAFTAPSMPPLSPVPHVSVQNPKAASPNRCGL